MDGGGRRRMLLGGLAGAAAIGLSRVIFEKGFAFPGMANGKLRVDPTTGLEYLVTKAGNKLVVSTDAEGHVWMVDQAGNLYFDPGNESVGVFIVARDGWIENIWEESGRTYRKAIGNIDDMYAVPTKEFGTVVGLPPRKDNTLAQPIDPDMFTQDTGLPKGTYPRVLEDRVVDPAWVEKLARKYGEIK